MSIQSSKPNSAKETGGNLDAQAMLLLRLEELISLQKRHLAASQVIAMHLGRLVGEHIDPDSLIP